MITEASMSLFKNARAISLVWKALIVVPAMVLISSLTFAQSDSNPKWDVFVGYQWLHPDATVPMGSPSSPTAFKVPDMPRGGGGDLTYNFDPHWGVEADLGVNGGNGNKETTASIGPRFMWRTSDTNFFIHALIGGNWLSVNGLSGGTTGLGGIAGGGMELPLTKHLAFRLFEADYVFGRHNYADDAPAFEPSLQRVGMEGVRLRTGITFSWGGAPAVAPAATCTVQPTEVMVGEPITATVSASNFNPKHTVTYNWSGNGGTVTGKDTTATIDTTNAAPGSYTVTAHVTDPKSKSNNEAMCSANYTVKPLPPKNPPAVSLSASPSELVTGGNANVSASCTSPDGFPVSVANWTSTAGTVSGEGNSATLSTAGVPAGSVTVTATCTDSRGLASQASTQVMVENPPPPPVDKALEARLALHSVYFPTNMPPVKDPSGGLIASQQKTLVVLATDFKKYLEAKPDAHLILEGHADMRGSVAFNQGLSERRVARVKSFLVEQGVPESDIETKAYGKERNLTLEEVRASIENNSELTTEERKRALARINVIKLASNRRVDVTLNSAGQTETSVRQFPFNAADALTLIGGRESEMKKPAKPAPRKKPAKKQ
jgi:outer membrane protein OmpA-like peptidoglycan-associated protein